MAVLTTFERRLKNRIEREPNLTPEEYARKLFTRTEQVTAARKRLQAKGELPGEDKQEKQEKPKQEVEGNGKMELPDVELRTVAAEFAQFGDYITFSNVSETTAEKILIYRDDEDSIVFLLPCAEQISVKAKAFAAAMVKLTAAKPCTQEQMEMFLRKDDE